MYRKMISQAVLALGLLGSAPVLATTIFKMEVPELSRTSDAVVQGKVKEKSSRWSGDGRRIFTEVVVEVDESLKGGPPQTVVIRQPGGQVGDIVQKVSGLAAFQPGEEVVVFLEQRPDKRYMVNGMAQGKYQVVRTDQGTVLAVPAPLENASLVDPRTKALVHEERPPLKLETLKSEIRSAVAGQRGARQPAKPAPGGQRPGSDGVQIQ